MAYVYRHIRNDKNLPFYIGIGTDSTFKRAKESSRRSQYWKRIVNKTGYEVEILFDGITIDEAKEKEIEFISATKISACLNGRRKTTGGYEFKRIWKGKIL